MIGTITVPFAPSNPKFCNRLIRNRITALIDQCIGEFLSKIDHAIVFLVMKVLTNQEKIHLRTARRKKNTLFGHCFVAKVVSRLIGAWRFAL
jgi:hypothetical protein